MHLVSVDFRSFNKLFFEVLSFGIHCVIVDCLRSSYARLDPFGHLRRRRRRRPLVGGAMRSLRWLVEAEVEACSSSNSSTHVPNSAPREQKLSPSFCLFARLVESPRVARWTEEWRCCKSQERLSALRNYSRARIARRVRSRQQVQPKSLLHKTGAATRATI